MALRSLAGKLRGLLPGRATTSSRSAASDLHDMALEPIKIESSVEAKVLAVRTSIRKEERLICEEFERLIRKDYRDVGIIAVTGVGLITFFWSRATEAFVDVLDAMEDAMEAKRMKMFAEGLKATNAEGGKAMDAEEGEAKAG